MIVGFALVVVILIGWQMLFKPKGQPLKPVPVAQPAAAQPETARTPGSVGGPATETGKAAPAALTLVPAEVVPETTIVIENKVLRLEFSNLGGALKSAFLKQYGAELVPPGKSLLGTALLLPAGPHSLDAVPMRVAATDTSVVFTARTESLIITKTYTLGKDYVLDHRVAITGPNQGLAIDGMAGLAPTEKNAKTALGHFSFYSHVGKKARAVSGPKLRKPHGVCESADWVGIRSKYFLLAAAACDETFDSTYATPLPDGRVGFAAVIRQPAPETRFNIYVGPLDYGRLKALGIGLESTSGLGWTKPLVLAILWLLRVLHKLFGNWGVAIVIFSILMKAAFYPLTRTQTRQMRQMQLLQPKLNELKTKYKDNPQLLNQETMQLYKLYKINPLSGCLPLLVQLPVFWALYAALQNAIELRGAAFVFWLKDLSEPDMLFGHLPTGIPFVGGYAIGLVPVLMGVSFIAQNMLTSADKKNWALTIIFPVFITAIFLNMPSGLQLYWFMYNILSIGESLVALKGGALWRKPRTRKEDSLPSARPPGSR
jgi:YidC/Oxa1 family membrane protein insertase